ncbi:hypothetical protein D3C80_947600 [compost metagenome]
MLSRRILPVTVSAGLSSAGPSRETVPYSSAAICITSSPAFDRLMRGPRRTTKALSSCSSRRLSAWLTAGWLRCRRAAARLMLPSWPITRNVRNRFQSRRSLRKRLASGSLARVVVVGVIIC